MSRHALPLSVALLCLASACGSDGSASGDGESCPNEGEELSSTKLYIEHNASDADTGVHALFAADGWTVLCLTDPNGERLIAVRPENQLGDLGLADLFWESREPENSEYSIDELKADFPEGEYQVSAVDVDGNPLASTARFTHAIPAPPTITAPDQLAEDAETAGSVTLPTDDFEVRWEPVTETLDGEPFTAAAYQVIVSDVDAEDPHGNSQPVYDVHVGPDATSLVVPPAFFRPATVYEIEVLAIGETGNQTISHGFFTTAQ